MSQRSTKVRTGDWRSIEKALNQLGTSKLGSTSSPTYKNVYVTNNVSLQGGQLTDWTIQIVADAAERLALTWREGKLCYQRDEGTIWLATTY
jgi:hypothetical protein